MATIRKRVGRDGAVSYQVQVRLRGQSPRTRTFKRKTDAKEWARDIESQMGHGKYVPTTEERKRTLSDLVDKYIRDAIPKKEHNKDRRNLETRLAWWKDQLGHRYLSEIRPSDIAECRDSLEAKTNRNGEPLTGATVNRYLAAIGAAYKHAVKEWHWVESSPVGNVGRRTESVGRKRYLDDDDHQNKDERNRLLEAVKAHDNSDLYPAVLLAMTTGMRKGEILSLRSKQVDIARSLIKLVDTKNGEERSVPMPKIAADLLNDRMKAPSSRDDRVFREERDFDRSWREALATAGIEDFRFHDLRHTAASYLAMHGATLAELAEILGHKTLQMVKRYSHLTEQHKRGLVDRMAAGVFGDE